MNFEKYLDIDYSNYPTDKKSFVWGYDEDIFLKNTFAQAFLTKNIEFLREIKLSVILTDYPLEVVNFLEKIRKNPPLVTSIVPVICLGYDNSGSKQILQFSNRNVCVELHKTLEVQPENDWILHSIILLDGEYYIRYKEVARENWLIPIDIKRDIQLQKINII